MMHIPKAIILILYICLQSCGSEETLVGNERWQKSNFVHPNQSRIIITNNTDSLIQYSLNLRTNYRYDLADKKISLGSLASDTIDVRVHKPLYFYLNAQGKWGTYILMPTYDRHISVGEDTVKNIDENKRRYDYLDHRFTELVRGNRWPSNLVSIDIMVNDFRREYRVTDTLNSKNDGAKDWLRAFGAEEAELFAYSRSLHLANYLRYIGQDTLLLSETTENKIIDLLGTNALYYRPSYIDLFREYSWYHRIDNNLSGADYVLRDFLTLYFLPAHRNDAVAYYIDMVNNSSWTEFEDRDQYDSIRNSLPPSHQGLLSVNPFDATKVAASKKDDLLQFFGREFVADENNRKRKILNDDIDKITLYKFWFVGCRPCVVQQEFEQGLLEEFADLEIVYVCHSSSKSSWLNYQQELSVDVKYGVYVPSVTSEDLETATGRLGAPLYVLMDGAEEIVCDDCPNPSGNTLRELIATHHN